jgi:phosphoglycolate phosphatase
VGDLHRLIAFDLDGTLIDSRRDLTDSANDLLQELGGPALTEEAVARMVGEGAAMLVRRALAASGLVHVDVADVLPRFLEIYDTRLLRHTRTYAGIDEAVRYARSHARVIVLTNKPGRPSERILTGLGIRDLFDEVMGGDGPWPRKPDPASLRAAMEQVGATPEQTLLVGDSAIDLETARRASVRCCLAAYGFSAHTVERARIGNEVWVVDAPSELPAVIDAFVSGA